MDLETAHVEDVTPFSRWLAVLVGVGALVAALLASLQVDAGKREERALIMANRLSVQIFEETAASGSVTTFVLESGQEALLALIEGSVRAQISLGGEDLAALQRAAADAATRAGEGIETVIAQMTARPGPGSGIDPHTLRLVGDAVAEIEGLLAGEDPPDPDRHPILLAQHRQVDLAERYGVRGNRAVFALSLLAVAAVLLGLAGVTGDGSTGRSALVSAAVMLTGSVGVGVWALLG